MYNYTLWIMFVVELILFLSLYATHALLQTSVTFRTYCVASLTLKSHFSRFDLLHRSIRVLRPTS